jgi:hypothetical protein
MGTERVALQGARDKSPGRMIRGRRKSWPPRRHGGSILPHQIRWSESRMNFRSNKAVITR